MCLVNCPNAAPGDAWSYCCGLLLTLLFGTGHNYSLSYRVSVKNEIFVLAVVNSRYYTLLYRLST